ncbi:hypothetical protein RDWZM_009517 [Blomia tropicalis]|uniref:DUF7041 domain-containing protein n=1 Tax=Blomia tropicalis TaxID=40697 RepID=A0A9Q0M6Q3_BLOTA|nr:hypothetical protein RDWZM_009517 [Blomia tropicalis]
MQRGSKSSTSDPLFEAEDILRTLGLEDDLEETMEMDRVVWNSSIQQDAETKLLADRPPSTSAVVPSATRPKAISSSPKPASAQAAPGLSTTAGSSRNMEIRDDTFIRRTILSLPRFSTRHPIAWWVRITAMFDAAGINSERTQVKTLLSQLDEDVACRLLHITNRPFYVGQLEDIRVEIEKTYVEAKETRVQRLLSQGPRTGRPTQILRDIRVEMGRDLSFDDATLLHVPSINSRTERIESTPPSPRDQHPQLGTPMRHQQQQQQPQQSARRVNNRSD